jgi:GT2 family glycosyltransferase
VPSGELPSFDLVVATVGRAQELDRFLDSLERQTHTRFVVHVVDQSGDDRLRPVLAAHRQLSVAHLRSPRGLSRARNAALRELGGDIVAFPDDDCRYPEDVLERVARRFAGEPELDGLAGRVVDDDGRSAPTWNLEPAALARDNLWNRVNSAALFLRREVVERVGGFDERLGVGSGEPWSSAEEVDHLVRALDAGARIEYDPDLTVVHRVVPLDPALGFRDGASVGYVLRKHRYPARVVARMLLRPLGGAALALARRDAERARFHAATLRGRLRGYRRSRSAKSVA